jgi:hypothetical protein
MSVISAGADRDVLSHAGTTVRTDQTCRGDQGPVEPGAGAFKGGHRDFPMPGGYAKRLGLKWIKRVGSRR